MFFLFFIKEMSRPNLSWHLSYSVFLVNVMEKELVMWFDPYDLHFLTE